jgi:hypothetical protein
MLVGFSALLVEFFRLRGGAYRCVICIDYLFIHQLVTFSEAMAQLEFLLRLLNLCVLGFFSY